MPSSISYASTGSDKVNARVFPSHIFRKGEGVGIGNGGRGKGMGGKYGDILVRHISSS